MSALKRLSVDYHSDAPETVLCTVLKDRSEADHWIEIKHTGYQDGVGPLRWGPDEGARFRSRTGGTVDIETQVLDYLQERGDITPEFRNRVPTTTFRRLLRTPAVREKLGIGWKDNTLLIEGEVNAVAKALLYVASDLAERRITVRELDRQADRVRYAESLPSEIIVIRRPAHVGTQASTTATRESSNTRPRQRIRDRLIPGSAALNVTDTRVRDIETELKRLSLQQYPNAVSVLFRVFLELSSDAYIENLGLSGLNEYSSLGTKLQAVTNDLAKRSKLTSQQARVVRRASERDSYLGPSITGLHQYVHNKHLFPGPGDLRADWDSLQPWFKAVWGP